MIALNLISILKCSISIQHLFIFYFKIEYAAFDKQVKQVLKIKNKTKQLLSRKAFSE